MSLTRRSLPGIHSERHSRLVQCVPRWTAEACLFIWNTSCSTAECSTWRIREHAFFLVREHFDSSECSACAKHDSIAVRRLRTVDRWRDTEQHSEYILALRKYGPAAATQACLWRVRWLWPEHDCCPASTNWLRRFIALRPVYATATATAAAATAC